MASLKDMLKQALACKNTQAHRIVPGSKRARQLLARNKNSCDIHQTRNKELGSNESAIEFARGFNG